MSVRGPMGGRVEPHYPKCLRRGTALVRTVTKTKLHIRRRFVCRECGYLWTRRGPLSLTQLEADHRRLGEAIRAAEDALMSIREETARLVKAMRRDR